MFIFGGQVFIKSRKELELIIEQGEVHINEVNAQIREIKKKLKYQNNPEVLGLSDELELDQLNQNLLDYKSLLNILLDKLKEFN